MAIKLYELCGRDPGQLFSPHCWKVRLALRHKGLDFETVPVPFTKIPDVEGGASKTIPVIRDGDKVVADSFKIAEYLDETYPSAPTLFGGEGGRQLSRFVESWSQRVIHPALAKMLILDIHDILSDTDQAYFRQSREKAIGKPLETIVEGREAHVEAFLKSLEPLRGLLGSRSFIGGETPLFADFIVFGPFQWARVASAFSILPKADPVAEWFERCLDLYEAEGRKVPAAA
ncbi:Glutathione S-transferase [Fulvimarina manganoxydans]|uniref:Glutathione S-transferase n=1 Tax=Fulvimarina manganoxydans TaxID=937218 RepID=A0A1W1ZRR7_9HYPH|nr:glutathione S-transferase family protein [Fulvimarina manganoxydans]MEE2952163.1 glutathione S-transferase family protein [Pseudomonadota bacterium]SMC51119.1 Glutathione S-transferase [Fulvimarina manganoxydans]